MTWIGRIRERRLAGAIRAEAEGYAADVDRGARRAAQLDALNRAWADAVLRVPHWGDLVRAGDLPPRFDALEQFAERVPPTGRNEVSRLGDRLAAGGRPADFQRMTGGSTAEPVRLPAWRSELSDAVGDTWVGRSWYGVGPAARLFLIWGHSHLLGTGWRGRWNGWKRRVADALLGYERFSAYDLDDARLRAAADRLRAFRPDWMLGYSVALDRFARANADRAEELRALRLALVVATSEGFPAPDSAARLADLFGAPVAMEYGSVETGALAHTHPDGGYRVFWRRFLLEVDAEPGGRGAVRVTSLTPRKFPLVRYELGDEIELGEGEGADPVGPARFARVLGRCNDYVPTADGALIHSEAFSHAVRPCAAVRAFQVARTDSGLVLRVETAGTVALDAEEIGGIRERLARVHPELGAVEVRTVPALERTVAGKTRMVVDERGRGV